MRTSALQGVIKNVPIAQVGKILCTKYKAVSANAAYGETTGISVDGSGTVLIYDPDYNTATSASIANFKNSIKGVILAFEKA